MMERKTCWCASDGKAYPTLEQCQEAEIQRILDKPIGDSNKSVAMFIVENGKEIVNILTTTDSSRPKARKLNGATRKPRTAKAKPAVEDPFSVKAHQA